MEQDRHSVAAEIHPDESHVPFEEHDFVAHFQRVSISGEDTSGVPLDDLDWASTLLVKALELREKYMRNSHQNFPQTTARFLKSTHPEKYAHQEKKSIAGSLVGKKRGGGIDLFEKAFKSIVRCSAFKSFLS